MPNLLPVHNVIVSALWDHDMDFSPLIAKRPSSLAPASANPARPSVCRYEHFTQDWYKHWAGVLGQQTDVHVDRPTSYRKIWEWAVLLETMHARGMLEPGKRGLGFAVGQERLPSIMAAHGVLVIATDLDVAESKANWVEQGQHSQNVEQLFYEEIIDRQRFDDLVRFQTANMNAIEGFEEGTFDFVWSSCAFEHLGTLEAGTDFVKNAMRLLKPGGIAFHTTEYNVSSNDDTVLSGDDCIYRRKDFEQLDRDLRSLGCGMEPIDFDSGFHAYDLMYDQEPFLKPGRVHIKLKLDGYICTSALIIVHKA